MPTSQGERNDPANPDAASPTADPRLKLVDQAMKNGQSLQQMQEAGVLAKYDHLGKGFIKTASFVELIYNELRGGAQPPR